MQYIDNKYTKWYYAIIYAAQNRRLEPEVYVERHHIVPKSLGGGDEVSNLVPLFPKEHFTCHLLLTKMCTSKDQHKMIYAAWTMARTRKGIRVTSRTYAGLKEKAAKIQSESNKKRYQDPEQRRKTSAALTKRLQDPELRRKRSEENKKRCQDPEYRRKMSEAAKKATQAMTPEQRKARAEKAWETRRLNAANQLAL